MKGDAKHRKPDKPVAEVVEATALIPTAPQPMRWKDMMSMGDVLAKSGMFTDVKTQAQAVVKVMAGRELGIGPIVALTKIYVVQGRVALSAEVMAGLIKRHPDYDYRIVEHTDKICKLVFYHKGKSIGESTFTIEDAKRARVAHGVNWYKYPRNMLFARAISNGARWYCPHLIAGAYTPDEMGMAVDNQGEVVDIASEVEVVVSKPTLAELKHLAIKYKLKKSVRKFIRNTIGKESAEQLTEDEANRLISIIKKRGERHGRNSKRAKAATE